MISSEYRHVCYKDLDRFFKKDKYFSDLTEEEKNKIKENLGISDATLEKILNNSQDLELTPEEIDRINIAIDQKKDSKNKRIIKFLDLIFRFVAMVMALVTLMLCINENIDVKALVVLLSIGLVCSSMTLLPKIDK